MGALDALRARLPEAAKDVRTNLSSVLQPGGALSPAQAHGVAAACALATRAPALIDAVLADGAAAVGEAWPKVLDDATAAAVLMGMNNVYYRFRHMVGVPAYGQKPARLRMARLAQPATSKGDLELFSLAVSAIHGCEACLASHERAIREAGLSEEQVHDAVRIGAVLYAAAIALAVPVPAALPAA